MCYDYSIIALFYIFFNVKFYISLGSIIGLTVLKEEANVLFGNQHTGIIYFGD